MRASDRKAAVEALTAALAVVEEKLPRAIDRTYEYQSLGYPATSMPSAFGRGTVSDPTGNLVSAGVVDVYGTERDRADRELQTAVTALAWLRGFALRHTEVIAMDDSTLIECANPRCDTLMTGLPNDRPRNGRCGRCYMHWYRYREDWPTKPGAAAAS